MAVEIRRRLGERAVGEVRTPSEARRASLPSDERAHQEPIALSTTPSEGARAPLEARAHVSSGADLLHGKAFDQLGSQSSQGVAAPYLWPSSTNGVVRS